MKSFSWGAHLVTGLTKVDEQHHRLVEIINQFSSLLAENVLHAEDVDRLYVQLADYTVYHFQEEVKLMSEVKVDPRHLYHHIDLYRH